MLADKEKYGKTKDDELALLAQKALEQTSEHQKMVEEFDIAKQNQTLNRYKN